MDEKEAKDTVESDETDYSLSYNNRRQDPNRTSIGVMIELLVNLIKIIIPIVKYIRSIIIVSAVATLINGLSIMGIILISTLKARGYWADVDIFPLIIALTAIDAILFVVFILIVIASIQSSGKIESETRWNT